MQCVLQTYPAVDKYVERLLEARKGKNLTPEAAYDAVTNDVNMFGVMMVAAGEAAGMVSGAIHTTAATIRPAMQVRMDVTVQHAFTNYYI
jgi:phosphotransacetylase